MPAWPNRKSRSESSSPDVHPLHEFLLNAPVMVVVHDGRDSRIELFNLCAKAEVGGRDLTGKRLVDAFPDLEPYLSKIAETVRGGRPVVGVNEPFTLDWSGHGKPETRYLTFFYQPVPGADGRVERSVMVAFDVTASLAGVGAEHGEMALLHAALDAIATPVVLAEPGTARIVFANAAARALSQSDLPSGTTFAQAIGMDTGYFCTDPAGALIDERDLPAARAARGELVDGSELEWHSPRGVVSLVCFAERVPATGTLPSFIVVSFFDVSALRVLERELQEASAGREEFLTLVAHELRTPLAALKLRAHALLKTSPRSEGLAAIERASLRMEALIEQMLEAERIRTEGIAVHPEQLDLCETVDRVVSALRANAERAGCTITRTGATKLVGRWDPHLLELAVANVVRNAIRFGPGTPISIACSNLGERVSVAVSDGGIGIDPADHERIFERFGRAVSARHFGGLGLGLWMARAIVKAMGGSIMVRSALGQGATFTVELPRSGSGPAQAPESSSGAAGSMST